MISDLLIGLLLVAVYFATIVATAASIGKLAEFFSKRKPK
jgi:hypothetical protein